MTNEYILLYQCGIANVFKDDRRVLQHAFSPCEWFARGLRSAGHNVRVMHCDVAGDASLFRDRWQEGAGDMFNESKRFSE